MSKRKHYRVYFNPPLPASLSITRIQAKSIQSKIASVYLHDLSASGLKFSTSLRLPVTEKVSIKISFTLLNHDFDVEGVVVRKEEMDTHRLYGVMFSERYQLLSSTINKLSLKII